MDEAQRALVQCICSQEQQLSSKTQVFVSPVKQMPSQCLSLVRCICIQGWQTPSKCEAVRLVEQMSREHQPLVERICTSFHKHYCALSSEELPSWPVQGMTMKSKVEQPPQTARLHQCSPPSVNSTNNPDPIQTL
eukprot:scaffold315485_cov13-Tisochrysis_lutea.AAC.2